ncbi:hypothetical protein T07_4269 [Trichinella nelsoni]|uniref:Uncharacterized protein n=1 Tax=Trichinella nelsoni TaxID=6336 RepID=A0A0V0REI8_9BILA|nr:hypothetical protein T07_4269 [Trichinella nelsoni]
MVLDQTVTTIAVQLRQTPNRGNKPSLPASSKDTASENRGRLLATNPHDPTSRCLTSRRSAWRSVTAEEPQAGGLSAGQWRDRISVDPPRCPPAAEYFYIWKRRRPWRQLSSGRVWSAIVATIRERMMATRRIDRGSEDESAKSNSGGRTGADLEADRAAAPGGSLQDN